MDPRSADPRPPGQDQSGKLAPPVVAALITATATYVLAILERRISITSVLVAAVCLALLFLTYGYRGRIGAALTPHRREVGGFRPVYWMGIGVAIPLAIIGLYLLSSQVFPTLSPGPALVAATPSPMAAALPPTPTTTPSPIKSEAPAVAPTPTGPPTAAPKPTERASAPTPTAAPPPTQAPTSTASGSYGLPESIATVKHGTRVGALTFSPDRKTLATAGEDKTIRLWDLAKQEEIRRLTGLKYSAQSVTFSPDGRLIAAASHADLVVWESASGKTVTTASQARGPVVFSPDGKWLAHSQFSGTFSLRILDTTSWKQLANYEGKCFAHSLAFSPDGGRIAAGCYENTALIWSVESGAKSAEIYGNSYPVEGIAFAPDGRSIATADGERVRIWDSATGKLLGNPGATSRSTCCTVSRVAYSGDGKMLATTGPRSSQSFLATIWEADTGQELRSVPGSFTTAEVAFAASGDLYIASGDYNSGSEGAVDVQVVPRRK